VNDTVSRNSVAGLAGAVFLIIAGLLASCQTEEPPVGDHVLRLSLADSLSRYDSVIIVILDAADTGKVLESVWAGPLFDPAHVPPKKLTAAKDKPFIVRITAYSGDDQLALRTWISYDGTHKTVTHDPIPVPVPRFWIRRISPSVGAISPALNQDTLDYQLLLPEGADTLKLDVQPAHERDALLVEADTVKRGAQAKAFSVGNQPRVIPITVTSILGMRRDYHVTLIPHSPVPVALARIEVIAPARLDPEFDFETTEYGVNLYNGDDSLDMIFYPADPATMTMTITDNDKDIDICCQHVYRAGIRHDTTEHHFSISVKRGGIAKSYDLYLGRK
jgi:hypothetical protein